MRNEFGNDKKNNQGMPMGKKRSIMRNSFGMTIKIWQDEKSVGMIMTKELGYDNDKRAWTWQLEKNKALVTQRENSMDNSM